ncbi:MAG: response regulator [Deltaproteobacteria bacterium]|nr:MAG: response regulator [Deltaproteobacteria bacterium]
MFIMIPVGAVTLMGHRGLWWLVPTVAVVMLMMWLNASGYEFPNVIPPEDRRLDSVLTWFTSLAILSLLITRYDAEYARSAEELRASLKQADIASKAKARFLASLSHELRTPLHGVLGMLELAKETTATDKRNERIEAACRAAEMLSGLMGDLFDLSQIERGTVKKKSEPFSPHRLLQDVLGVLGVGKGDGHARVSVSILSDVPRWLIGDRFKLRQVLVNLIGNAQKYAPNGDIGIKVTKLLERGTTCMLRFEVRDDGPGIDPQILPFICEPFFRGQTGSQGAGLGLAITSRLLEIMGGRLRVTSTPGQGSSFWFDLEFEVPGKGVVERLMAQEAKPRTTTPKHGMAAAGARGLVLVVEDNPIGRQLMKEMLERAGCNVREAADGRQAVDLAEVLDMDLILMDLNLPVMDGYEAVREIRKMEKLKGNGREVPIVAVTALAVEVERERCLREGMNDFIAKPFGMKELESLLGRWLGEKSVNDPVET